MAYNPSTSPYATPIQHQGATPKTPNQWHQPIIQTSSLPRYQCLPQLQGWVQSQLIAGSQRPPSVQSHSSQDPSEIDKEREPWRYKGYPEFSKWVASDDDFFVLRKFGTASARVTLMMQDRIECSINELEARDKECQRMGKDSGTFRYDEDPHRQKILEKLSWQLEKYYKFIHRHSKIKARPDATHHQTRNVKNWFYNNREAIDNEETGYIQKEGDLMTLVPQKPVPLRRFLGKFDFIRKIGWFRERRPNGVNNGPTIYNNDGRIDSVVTCITIFFGLAMLIGPLWLLQHTTADKGSLPARLGIISGFIVAFTALLSIVTVAHTFEVLAATAAYSAVLMVFVQMQAGS